MARKCETKMYMEMKDTFSTWQQLSENKGSSHGLQVQQTDENK